MNSLVHVAPGRVTPKGACYYILYLEHMHSFLIAGRGENIVEKEIDNLMSNLKAKRLDFEFRKIQDVRELNSFTQLQIDKPTAIVLRGVDSATHEALNAFLKNLEEPQINLYYILTASSLHRLLPTVVSRCHVIRIKSPDKQGANRETQTFFESTIGERINHIASIKERDVAVKYMEGVIESLHNQINSDGSDYLKLAHTLKLADTTRRNLIANGNVQLQLTNFVVNSSI